MGISLINLLLFVVVACVIYSIPFLDRLAPTVNQYLVNHLLQEHVTDERKNASRTVDF